MSPRTSYGALPATSGPVLLPIDRQMRRVLVDALDELERRLARDALRLPADLVALRQTLRITTGADRNRQGPTMFAEPVEGLDADHVLLTFARTADALTVSQRTVERLVTAGELPVVSIGSSKRVRAGDVSAYIDERTRS